jgi:aldehyde:ferredoxin oxidoreductase
MKRRLLHVDATTRRWWLEALAPEAPGRDPREDYFVLSGEPLCQYLLRRDAEALVVARGPLPFLAGNKASVGYVSPLTGVPHYSFVGGRAAAQLFALGLDGIVFHGPRPEARPERYLVVEGRAPDLAVTFEPADALPAGQRSAYYWLVERALDGEPHAGSVFTLGSGARWGYASANVAVEAIYHAGRGGAGAVLARFVGALVLRGRPVERAALFAGVDEAFARNPNAAIAPLLDVHCARLSGKVGGTVTKLETTGTPSEGPSTLPARNARQLGYELADLGGARLLKALRDGQTGCHWCPVDCRHYHWVDVDYAPEGRDMFLDDFEPTYAVFAMLGLTPAEDTLRARLDFRAAVERRVMLPIEQMGCDVMNVGLGLAALLEGVGRDLIPAADVPAFLVGAEAPLGDLETVARAVEMLHRGEAEPYPALRAAGDGPQALADAYPALEDIVFTGGRGTLGNAGHANALWTFLMPFGRFFGHYVGQYYKVEETLPPPGSDPAAYQACFRRVVERLLDREFYWLLANALSQCAFTFVIFSQDGAGARLRDDHLLTHILGRYGIRATPDDLRWFAQNFWAQSMDLKCQFGWRPPAAEDFPRRVYEALALALERPPEELQALMALLIEAWKRQAGEVMRRFGYEAQWESSATRNR